MKSDSPAARPISCGLRTTNIMSVVERSGRNPHCCSGNSPLASQYVIDKSPGNHFNEHLTRVWHGRDAAVVSAFGFVAHVAHEETNDCCTSHPLQPVTCMPDGPPQPRFLSVYFQALLGCVYRISRSLKISFRLGICTPTSTWSLSLLGWHHQFSGLHDSRGECGFRVVHTASSWRIYSEVASNGLGVGIDAAV